MELFKIDTQDGKHPITVAVADMEQATRLEKYISKAKESLKKPVFTIAEQKSVEGS